MRLSPTRVEQTLSQFEASVLPDDHPAMPRIKGLWGDHTYFLAPNGLNIVEPIDGGDAGIEVAAVINLADWTDGSGTSLAAHEPQSTEVVLEFDAEADGDIDGNDSGVKTHWRH
jgi:hypothetical protein